MCCRRDVSKLLYSGGFKLISLIRYLRAQMGVKRIVSVRESPLISHFNDTINGVVTIRAFSCQKQFLDENLKRIDNYTLPYVHLRS